MEKQASVTAQTEVKKETRNLPYTFNNEELLKLGKELAEKQNHMNTLEADRKSVVDQWKSKISQVQSEISIISLNLGRGYDYRDIPCETTLNDPIGKKTTRRVDTGEIVDVSNLTDSERQRTLEFEKEAKEKAAESTGEKPAEETGDASEDSESSEVPN